MLHRFRRAGGLCPDNNGWRYFRYLCDLYVDRSVRGTGVATALVDARCHAGGRVP
ncbi:GNAT family N-acetyltransferase [Arthrobacter sp. R4-81]